MNKKQRDLQRKYFLTCITYMISEGSGGGGGGIITRLKTELQNKLHTSVAVLINSKRNQKSNLFQYKQQGRLYM